MKKILHFLFIPIIIFIILFFTRLVMPTELDDVSSSIQCEKELLKIADIYYVIPRFNNITNNEEWCNNILELNKTLALHGVTHEYKEFQTKRNEEYLQIGINDFEKCFGFYPEKFKAPNLKWTSENNWIKNKLEVSSKLDQLTHKVYHCNDTGLFPNWIIKIF